MIKKISPNSDTSNSDSGRGHSSEEGDTLHRVQSVGRDHDNAPTPSLAPGAALATVAKDVRSLSDDDADGWLPFSVSAKFALVPSSFNRHRDVTGAVLFT